MEQRTDFDVDVVCDIIITVLGEEHQVEPDQVRASLEEAGAELPIDSLLIVEVLTRVEQQCGVRVPADTATARSMRSVRDFAETIIAAAVAAADEPKKGE